MIGKAPPRSGRFWGDEHLMAETEESTPGVRAIVGEAFVPAQVLNRVLAAERRRQRLINMLFLFAVALGVALWLEPYVTGAELVTPLSPWLLWPIRMLGLVLGLAVMFWLDPPGNARWPERIRRVVLFLLIPALGGLAMNSLTWRAARWLEFGLSDQPYGEATYALSGRFDVVGGQRTWKRGVRIDPFGTGEPLYIRIPPQQSHVVSLSRERLCITVRQRRSSSGAIEVKTDPWRPFRTPAVKEIKPCRLPRK